MRSLPRIAKHVCECTLGRGRHLTLSFGSRIFDDHGSLGVGPALKFVEPEVVLLVDVAGKQLITGFLDPSETMLGKWDGRCGRLV